MSRIGAWISAAALVAGAALGALAAGGTVTPSSGGISAHATLGDLGFTPTKKPKVKFVPHAGQTITKPVNPKVESFTSSTVVVQVTTGAAGVYDVVVTPRERGVPAVTLADTFTLVVPHPTSLDPTAGPWKTSLVVHGTAFGTPKGKVTIGGKNAAVRSWGDKQIRVLVPTRLATGAQSVVVKNKAGASDGALTFDCTGAPPKPNAAGPNDEYIRADLSGKPHFEATNAKLAAFSVTWDDAAKQLTFGGVQNPTKGVPSLYISTLPLDVTRAKPFDIGLTFVPPSGSLATLGYTDSTYKLHTAATAVPSAALTVTIDSWDGTFLVGRFHGTLIDLVGGTAPIEVTNGEFKTRRVTGH